VLISTDSFKVPISDSDLLRVRRRPVQREKAKLSIVLGVAKRIGVKSSNFRAGNMKAYVQSNCRCPDSGTETAQSIASSDTFMVVMQGYIKIR